MNYLDVIIAFPMLWAIYRGFTKGLIISVATLVALILGIFIAIHYSFFFNSYVNKWIHPEPDQLKIISFTISFLVVVILVRLLGWGLDKLIKIVALGFVNRLLGVLFNVTKWIFILSILINIADSEEHTKSIISEKTKQESIFYYPLSKVALFTFPNFNFDIRKIEPDDSSLQSIHTKHI